MPLSHGRKSSTKNNYNQKGTHNFIMEEQDFDVTLKFILVGDSGTGKSSLLRRFIFDAYQADRPQTIGVEFGSRVVRLADKTIKLQIWDTAGQERYRSVVRSYYRGAVGALVVYDVTCRESFNHVRQWIADTRSLSAREAVILLIGNKIDVPMEKKEVDHLEVSEYAQREEVSMLETSALTGAGVEEAFMHVVRRILAKIDSGDIDPHSPYSGVSLNESRSGRKGVSSGKKDATDGTKKKCC
eukprot:TRINITY_DN685_c0_g2_i1.p1 TRINITY_DN685_c0_g2~~TRINITY_DN685_c0_g2_i1.p1  ORF type:complete len:242 (-),score=65.30 TRINITY_DN685_c0_g2_i1:283-1008(-)